MTKRGYHRLVMPDGSIHKMVVCEFDAKNHLIAWHHLNGEEANVEWLGGEISL